MPLLEESPSGIFPFRPHGPCHLVWLHVHLSVCLSLCLSACRLEPSQGPHLPLPEVSLSGIRSIRPQYPCQLVWLFVGLYPTVCFCDYLCVSVAASLSLLSVSGTPPQGMHIPLLYVSPFGMRSVRLLTPCQRVWLDISLCVSDCLCAGRIPQGLYVLFFNCSFLCSQSGREVCVCLPFCLSVCCNDTLVL